MVGFETFCCFDYYDYVYSGFGYYPIKAKGKLYVSGKNKNQPKIFNGFYNKKIFEGIKRTKLNRRIMPCNNYEK
jgi:hypothetical protein